MSKKRLFGKICAVAMTCAIVCGSIMPVMAAAPTGAATEVKTVNVTNIEGAASVKAYRIVEPTFDATSKRLTGYKLAKDVSIADIENPTAAEITALTKAIKANSLAGLTSFDLTASGTEYTADLPAGVYVVLVTDQANADWVYNPMVVSVQYDDANDASKMSAKGADANTKFKEGSTDIYAKRSKIPFDKTIVSPDAEKAGDADLTGISVSGADDLQVGDTGHFQLYSQIPEYSSAYATVTYEISDNQDDGFDAPDNIKVFVDNVEITQADDTAKATVTGNDFTVTFASAYALANAGKAVKVTYDSKLNSNAVIAMAGNENNATLKYTNDLDGHFTEKTDKVKEYTFKLDGELIKVEKDNSPSVDGYVPLAGATFSLTRVETGDDKVTTESQQLGTMVTGADGKLKWDRLDEGTYKIKETAAPTGYSVNDTEYTVKITPSYEGSGKDAVLKSYTVEVSYVDASGAEQKSTFTYDGDTSTTGEASTTVENGKISMTNAIQIIDVKLASLPATGAGGTIAFSVIGGIGMALIAVMILKKRRERQSAE